MFLHNQVGVFHLDEALQGCVSRRQPGEVRSGEMGSQGLGFSREQRRYKEGIVEYQHAAPSARPFERIRPVIGIQRWIEARGPWRRRILRGGIAADREQRRRRCRGQPQHPGEVGVQRVRPGSDFEVRAHAVGRQVRKERLKRRHDALIGMEHPAAIPMCVEGKIEIAPRLGLTERVAQIEENHRRTCGL